MGTDIHGVFQSHDDDGKWQDVVSKFEENRHYQLFAVLAGVRNGAGFAGVKTGEPVVPISEPRGFPEDFEIVDEENHPIASFAVLPEWRRKYRSEGDPLEVWMGDHSHTWLTAEEMLRWFSSAPVVVQIGVLERAEYEKWDRTSPPGIYYGEICGSSTKVINDNQPEREQNPNWTHIRCEWDAPLKKELSYFFDEVKRLQETHGEVRFVFGFDS